MKPLKRWEPKEPEEPQYYLRFMAGDGLFMDAAIVDETGQAICDGYLATFNCRTGAISRCAPVNRRLGLDLNEEGRVKIDERPLPPRP